MPTHPRQTPTTTGFPRWALLAAGLLCTALALLGAFLPVLPTTPFLLVASACFVRSSPAFHRRLLANRAFGPYLAQWEHDHTIPASAKRKAYGLIALSFPLSILLASALWLRITLAVIGLGLILLLRWLPTTRERDSETDSPPG